MHIFLLNLTTVTRVPTFLQRKKHIYATPASVHWNKHTLSSCFAGRELPLLVYLQCVCVMDQCDRVCTDSASTGGWFLSGLKHQSLEVRLDLQNLQQREPDRVCTYTVVCRCCFLCLSLFMRAGSLNQLPAFVRQSDTIHHVRSH